MDELLAKLSARDVQAILTVGENPSWAATYPGGPIDLVDISELVQFLTAAVARYGAPPYNVKHWEMYNEPDNGDKWHALKGGYGYFGNQPQAYYDLLRAVYRRVKRVDPEAQIVFGGLAYDNWNDGENGLPFVRDFLDKVLELGGARYFDFMNFHYYPVFAPVWDPYGPGIIGKATFLRDKLAEYGVDKPFICTEAGMWSDAAHGGSDELQSRYVAQVYARSAAAELKPTIWYQLADDDILGTWKFGLVNYDLSPKPSYRAYQTAAQQLASAQYFRTLDHDETGTDQMEAYEFLTPSHSTRIIVAWTNDELEHPLVLQTRQVISVAKHGEETIVDDIDDGVSDGRVELAVGPSPVYLRFKP
jgi:hypothetical protein